MTDVDPLSRWPVVEPDQGADDPAARWPVVEKAPQPTEQLNASDSVAPRELGDNPADLLPVSPTPMSEQGETEADEHARLLLERARDSDPAKELEAYHLSNLSGAPLSMVKERLDDFRKSYKAAGTDARQWRRDNPYEDFLIREFPHMAPTIVKEQKTIREVVNQDDKKWEQESPVWSSILKGLAMAGAATGSVGGISTLDPKLGTKIEEKTDTLHMQDLSHLSGVDAAVDAFGRTAMHGVLARLGHQRMWLDAFGKTDEAKSKAEFILEQRQALGAPAFYGDGLGVRAATTVTEAWGNQVDSTAALGLGVVATAITRSPDIGKRVAQIAGAAASFVTESGGDYNDMVDTYDDQGHLIDKRIAFAAANVSGGLKAIIETGMLGVEAGGITSLDAKRWATRMLTDKTRRGALLDLAKTLTKNAAGEAGEEGTQTALELTLKWIAKTWSAGEVQAYDKDAAVREGISAAGQGALGSLVGPSALAMASQTAQQFRDLKRSHDGGATVAAINEVAKTDAAQAAPQEVAAFIAAQQQKDGRKVTHVYVDPMRLSEEAAKGGADVNEVARELMGAEGPRRLQDALDVHGDAPGARATLEIPLDEYLKNWGGKPIAETLAEDITTGPGLQTMRELRLFQKAVSADDIDAEAIGGEEHEELTGTIEEQLVAAGRPQREAKLEASIAARMASTLAKQSGRKTDDVLAEMFQITGVGIEKPAERVVRKTTAKKAERFKDAGQAFSMLEGEFSEDAASFDAVSEEFGVTVSSTKEAFETVYNRTKGSSVAKARAAVDFLTQISGLEAMRLPDEVLADELADRERQEAEAQRGQVEDASFEFGANIERLEQPSIERQKWEQLGEDEQARRYNTDPNTGLFTAPALEAAGRDPARPVLFKIDVPAKFINKLSQQTLDGALRRMAAALPADDAQRAAKDGTSLVFWGSDASQAQTIAEHMHAAIGDSRVPVTVSSATIPEGTSIKKAIAMADKGMQAVVGKKGTRKGPLPALLRETDPAVAWESGMDGLDPDDDQAVAIMDRSVGEMQDFRGKMEEKSKGAAPVLGDVHRQLLAVAKKNKRDFEDVHMRPSGLLASLGDETEGEFTASADVDYFREMNTVFGHDATDAINQVFGEILVAINDKGVRAANPHGDELGARSKNRDDVDELFSALAIAARQHLFFGTVTKEIAEAANDPGVKEGDIWVQEGLSFGHATDSNTVDAEAGLEKAKRDARRKRKASGTVDPAKPRRVTASELADLRARYGGNGRAYEVSDLAALRRKESLRRAQGQARRSLLDQVADTAAERLYQTDPSASPRGWIDIARNGSAKQLRIFLTKNADASTYLHESTHA
jgi:GGDEF domain-containing protein